MFILVTGGSGSGKSSFAEEQILRLGEGKRIYIATMMSSDPESRQRIQRHRRMRRDKSFETVEQYLNLKDLDVPAASILLLDCIANLTANEMFHKNGAGIHTVEAVMEGMHGLNEKAAHMIAVTNEVFSDGFFYDSETLRYQKYLGTINQKLAHLADQVVEVVCGIPLYLHGGPLRGDDD